jgi:hypothetical protein
VRRIRMIPAIAITSRSSVAFGYVGQRLSLPGDARGIHPQSREIGLDCRPERRKVSKSISRDPLTPSFTGE